MPRVKATNRTASSGRRSVQDIKSSLSFNGTSTLVDTNITPLITGFSLGFWVYLNKNNSSWHPMVSWEKGGDPSAGFNITVQPTADQTYALLYNGSKYCDLTVPNRARGVWKHIVYTHTQGIQNIYCNGVLNDTTNGTMVDASPVTMKIGTATTGWLFGKMSNFVFQNITTPWTQEQITALYQNGTIPSGATCVLPLQEGAGAIAYDSSGNGNNGTITSGTWTADVPSKKRGVVGGNMVPNGDFSFVPVVNVPQTANGNRWLDGTAGGSISNYLFGWSYSTNVSGSSSVMFDRNVKSPSGGNSIKVSTLAINSVGQVTTSAVDPITGAAVLSKPAFVVKPNTSYTYSYLMRTELVSGASNNGANILWKERNAAGANTVTNGNEIAVTTSSEWTLYAGSFTTAASTVNITPQPSVIGNTGAATLIMDAWFSNIDLRTTTPTSRTASI